MQRNNQTLAKHFHERLDARAQLFGVVVGIVGLEAQARNAFGFEYLRHRRFLGVVQRAELQVRIDHAVDVILARQAHDVVDAAI